MLLHAVPIKKPLNQQELQNLANKFLSVFYFKPLLTFYKCHITNTRYLQFFVPAWSRAVRLMLRHQSNLDVLFFSSGSAHRNRSAVRDLLSQEFGSEEIHALFQQGRIRIKSREHLTENRKDLTKVARLNPQQTLIVDDNAKVVFPDQGVFIQVHVNKDEMNQWISENLPIHTRLLSFSEASSAKRLSVPEEKKQQQQQPWYQCPLFVAGCLKQLLPKKGWKSAWQRLRANRQFAWDEYCSQGETWLAELEQEKKQEEKMQQDSLSQVLLLTQHIQQTMHPPCLELSDLTALSNALSQLAPPPPPSLSPYSLHQNMPALEQAAEENPYIGNVNLSLPDLVTDWVLASSV